MRTLLAGLVAATLFLGCELDTGEDPLGEGGEAGDDGTSGSAGNQSGSGGKGGSGGSAQAGSTANGGSTGSAGKGTSGATASGGKGGKGGSENLGGAGSGNSGSGGKGAQSGGSSGSSAGTSSGGSSGECAQDVRCTLDALPSTGDPYQDCVDRINQFRMECACLAPLERWTDGESCADEMAEYDSVEDRAHAGFGDGICEGGSAQNECPAWRSETQVVEGCLQQMWDEGPPPQDPCEGDCFQEYGHFINMTNERYTKVACGFYTTSGNEVWAVQNFSR